MPIAPKDLTMICDLVRRRSGIVLDEKKGYLIEARINGLARKLKLPNVEALLAKLRTPMPGDPLHAVEAVVEAMTTNETSFFRDMLPFEAFRQHVMPDILQRRSADRRLAIWSAASSTGQEPYTLCMLLREHFPQLASWTVTFVASDISQDVLVKARSGRYSMTDIGRGMPPDLLSKYFRKVGAEYEVVPDLRKMIDFRQVNLLEAWPTMPKLDIVFCRNVLIYFNAETKQKILGRMRKVMRPDGYLFLGAAETTLKVDDAFERGPMERSGCYMLRRTPAPAAAAPTPAVAAAPAPVVVKAAVPLLGTHPPKGVALAKVTGLPKLARPLAAAPKALPLPAPVAVVPPHGPGATHPAHKVPARTPAKVAPKAPPSVVTKLKMPSPNHSRAA